MKLCERPNKTSLNKSRGRLQSDSNENTVNPPEKSRRSSINAKSLNNSRGNSRKNSLDQSGIPVFNTEMNEENEMLLNEATQIDEKFYLNEEISEHSEMQEVEKPQPKVEIFVKRFPLNHEELEDIEGSENEDELEEGD